MGESIDVLVTDHGIALNPSVRKSRSVCATGVRQL
jgi:citrate lyase alpha subunit